MALPMGKETMQIGLSQEIWVSNFVLELEGMSKPDLEYYYVCI
jgi:hypothetical protein